jgi:hypothetical protein
MSGDITISAYDHPNAIIRVSEAVDDLAAWLRDMRPIAAQVCIETLLEVSKDRLALSSARVGAAKGLGEFAGLLGVKGAAGALKDPQDMSTSELHSQVAALEQALSERARVVPSKDDDLSQLIDLA